MNSGFLLMLTAKKTISEQKRLNSGKQYCKNWYLLIGKNKMKIPREIKKYLRIIWLISEPLKVEPCTLVFLGLLCIFVYFNWKKIQIFATWCFYMLLSCGIWIDCNLWNNNWNNNIAINSVLLWKRLTQLECSECTPTCLFHWIIKLHIKMMLNYFLQMRNQLCRAWCFYLIIVVSLVCQAKT